MRLNHDQLPAALGRGLAPIYLVSGEEPLLVGEAADAIRAAARAAGYADRTVFFIDRSFAWDELRHASHVAVVVRGAATVRTADAERQTRQGCAAAGGTRRADPPPDVVCLIITDKLDRKASEAAWVRAVEKHGVWVPIRPVDAAALPAWLRARAQTAQRRDGTGRGAADRRSCRRQSAGREAGAREARLLADGEPIGADLVLRSVGDSARYDVFQLAEAAAAGDAARALRVLLGLKSEGSGTDPDSVGAGAGTARIVAGARTRAGCAPRIAAAAGTWRRRPRRARCRDSRSCRCRRCSCRPRHTDRVIKGLALGDAWSALTGLTGGLAGALQATAESGRVRA